MRAGSPLVEGGRVIANIGGDKAGIVAFDAKTGKVVWTATDDDASYSSGMRRDDRRTTVGDLPDARQSVGLDPATGMVQFQRRWRARLAASVNAATPLVVGDLIFVSARVRARRRRAARRTARSWWMSGRQTRRCPITTRRASITTAICTDFTAARNSDPSFRAVEFQTGTVKWSQDQFRAGSVMLGGRQAADHARGRRARFSRPRRRRRSSRSPAHRSCQGVAPALSGARGRIRSTSATRTHSSAWTFDAEMRTSMRCLLALRCARCWSRARRGAARQRQPAQRFSTARSTTSSPAGSAESVTGFDRVVTLAPEARATALAARHRAVLRRAAIEDCRAQFESHRTVNPNDVENPAWHFLCVAHAESPEKARAALLPVGPDQRSPMREIYQMFRGTMTPEAVLAARRQRAVRPLLCGALRRALLRSDRQRPARARAPARRRIRTLRQRRRLHAPRRQAASAAA